MLETGGVGGVAGDGDVDAFEVHDGDAFTDVIGAIASDFCAFAVGVGFFADDFDFAGEVVEFGLDVGESVDSADDEGGVFSESVEDDAKWGFADFVGGAGESDGAFGGGKGFVTGEEGEAFGIFAQEHGGQVSVTEADFSVVGDGPRDAEGLEALADGLGGVGGFGAAFFDGDGGAEDVGPADVFKADGLDVFGDFVGVDALFEADFLGFFEALDAVLGEDFLDLRNAALVTFKQ